MTVKKFIDSIPGIVVLSPLLLIAAFLAHFSYTVHWEGCIDDFDLYCDDFCRVAEFCSEYIKEKRDADPDASDTLSLHYGDFLIYSPNIYARAHKVETDGETEESIKNVCRAFHDSDNSLSHIKCCDDGSVYFVMYGVDYAVAYCPNGKPRFVFGPDNDDKGCDYKRITGDFYHVVDKD